MLNVFLLMFAFQKEMALQCSFKIPTTLSTQLKIQHWAELAASCMSSYILQENHVWKWHQCALILTPACNLGPYVKPLIFVSIWQNGQHEWVSRKSKRLITANKWVFTPSHCKEHHKLWSYFISPGYRDTVVRRSMAWGSEITQQICKQQTITQFLCLCCANLYYYSAFIFWLLTCSRYLIHKKKIF